MKAIVTLCNEPYKVLLPYWREQIRKFSDLPIYVLALKGTDIHTPAEDDVIHINPEGNPFPSDLPDHACAEKLRLFDHLPASVTEIMFLDIDVMVLNDFWSDDLYFSTAQQAFVASPDLFVGYKEKMEEEFRPFDPSFSMKFFSDGNYHYFNTGVFFASRQVHASLFREFLKTWECYVKQTGRYPSIFDQNIINYCLISSDVEVSPMPVQNNCLRQYDKVFREGRVFLDGLAVNAMHFNGGDAQTKVSRWMAFAQEMTR